MFDVLDAGIVFDVNAFRGEAVWTDESGFLRKGTVRLRKVNAYFAQVRRMERWTDRELAAYVPRNIVEECAKRRVAS